VAGRSTRSLDVVQKYPDIANMLYCGCGLVRYLSSTTASRRRSSPSRPDLSPDSSGIAERMELFGPDLGMPHTRAMGGGLFELRIKAAEGIARVFYCTVVDRRIVILHQFVKKSEKTPPKELEIARRRMKEAK